MINMRTERRNQGIRRQWNDLEGEEDRVHRSHHNSKAPPKLLGYNFSEKQVKNASEKGTLLAMRLETSAICNLKCLYCNGLTGKSHPMEISLRTMKRVISEVKSLGGKSVVVIGGGEPTLFPHFKSLIKYITQEGMIPVVITNATKLSLDMVKFLYEENASILFKMDSLKESVQDYLSGTKGSYKLIMKGMEHLFFIGFNKNHGDFLRCGASFVVTQSNYSEIPELWKFCRDNNLYPNFEQFIPRHRGLGRINEFWVDKKTIHALKQTLLEGDRAIYGYDWMVHTPLPGHGCLQHRYSVYITSMGYIQPCADVATGFFNVKDMSISKALQTPFFQVVRNIEKHLRGKCSQCEYHLLCVGCRGLAFSIGREEGLDVDQALCREDPLCCK